MKRKNMKKLNASFISVLLLLSTLTILAVLPTASAFSGNGRGKARNPYQITNIEQLNEIRNDLSAHYKLMNDLDFNCDDSYANPDNKAGFITGSGWEPIGRYDDGEENSFPFSGTFDGNEKTISNLYIKRPNTNDVGLFGLISGVVENVGIIDVNIKGKDDVGGLIGSTSRSSSQVSNCYATGGTVTGNNRVGGLIGGNNFGKVVNCNVTGQYVTGNNRVGGLIGSNSGRVFNCYAHDQVQVKGNNRVGGLIGDNGGPDFLDDLFGKVANCWVIGEGRTVINGTGDYVGGLIGISTINTKVVNCWVATLVVEGGKDNVGGLIGCSAAYEVSNCYAYNSVSVTGNNRVGGLIGWNDGTVSNSYAAGDVTGNSEVGGLIGRNDGGSVSNSFWDTDTSGQSSSADGTGKTTDEMKSFETFDNARWDIAKIEEHDGEIWFIDDGNDYPRLLLPEYTNVKTRAIIFNPIFNNALARLLDNYPNMFPMLRALLKLSFGL